MLEEVVQKTFIVLFLCDTRARANKCDVNSTVINVSPRENELLKTSAKRHNKSFSQQLKTEMA